MVRDRLANRPGLAGTVPEFNSYPESRKNHTRDAKCHGIREEIPFTANSVYSKERNRIAVNLLKAKLQLRLNINVFCAEFTNVLNIDSLGKKLVNAKKKKSERIFTGKKR
jgi:hypothetical protein